MFNSVLDSPNDCDLSIFIRACDFIQGSTTLAKHVKTLIQKSKSVPLQNAHQCRLKPAQLKLALIHPCRFGSNVVSKKPTNRLKIEKILLEETPLDISNVGLISEKHALQNHWGSNPQPLALRVRPFTTPLVIRLCSFGIRPPHFYLTLVMYLGF